MAIQVKHSKVSTIPDTDDTSLVRPSDWNADHVLTGTVPVANGGTGADNATDARTNLSAAKSGANSDITSMTGVTGGISSPDYIQFDTTYATTLTTGQLGWDGNNSLSFGMDNNIVQEIGFQTYIYGKASSAITKGQLIQKTGAVGSSGVITFAPTTANMTNSTDIIGIAAENIALNAFGYIMSTGNLRGFNTTGSSSGETWADGDILYYNPSGNGLMTKVKPSAPNTKTEVAIVTNAGSGGSGSVVVEIIHGSQLGGTDSNVQITSPTTGQTLVYNQSTDIWSNSNAPTIIGGSINNTPIGATTPAAGTFTTITGQTEVLRGTGQNLFLQSNNFTTTWSQSNATPATTLATTDPFGGNSAWILTEDNTSNAHRIFQGVTTVNQQYIVSCYFKANTRTWGLLRISTSSGLVNAWFNLSTGVVGTVESGLTGAITSVGNGWYRCSVATSSAIAGTNNISVGMSSANGTFSYAGDGTSSLYIYGAQLELGSIANTFVPTTTTAVYGTPTLSFSGVSTLGLESNGALFLQPAGTGAIQAQATTSTSAGGNARGANAVDWQTLRSNANQVASASYSVISGGVNIRNAGFGGFVGSGNSNTVTGTYGLVGGGNANTSGAQDYCTIVGGQLNTSAGFFNFIGGGFTNSGTSGTAVTTQATTTVTSGSTAVTLSGSNANIRVGQLITGTGMANYTYVAAISGTSLTLSQNANASGSPTLSFFTPHGVVVGGGNNQATGAYSFIGGGGDAGNTTNRNTASGAWSAVVGGGRNTASGIGSFVGGGGTDGASYFANTASATLSTIAGGWNNTASATLSTICGGTSNTASATESFIGGGLNNTANATASAMMGGRNGTTRGIIGNHVFSAQYDSVASASGVAQSGLLVLGRQTTDATPTVLASSNLAAGTTNQVILPNNSAYYFKIEVIAGRTAAGDTKAWELKGAIKRGANAGTTTLVGTVTSTVIAENAGASAWTVTATADTTNGGIKVEVTGQASTTIRWVARCTTVEMTF